MKQVTRSNQFKKDFKKIVKRGCRLDKFETVIRMLLNDEVLPARYRNHKLVGNYADFWECHIEPDWLLIYRVSDDLLELARTGTHSDLF